jgi:hypothetical protein
MNYLTNHEADEDTDNGQGIRCPHCGWKQDDFDGFGFVHCFECGTCTHPSLTGGVCDICGQVEGASSPDVASPNGQTLICDRCKQPASRLEEIGECELMERWCLSCLKEEAERMREEEDRDAEMRSLKGYSDLERERI